MLSDNAHRVVSKMQPYRHRSRIHHAVLARDLLRLLRECHRPVGSVRCFSRPLKAASRPLRPDQLPVIRVSSRSLLPTSLSCVHCSTTLAHARALPYHVEKFMPIAGCMLLWYYAWTKRTANPAATRRDTVQRLATTCRGMPRQPPTMSFPSRSTMRRRSTNRLGIPALRAAFSVTARKDILSIGDLKLHSAINS